MMGLFRFRNRRTANEVKWVSWVSGSVEFQMLQLELVPKMAEISNAKFKFGDCQWIIEIQLFSFVVGIKIRISKMLTN